MVEGMVSLSIYRKRFSFNPNYCFEKSRPTLEHLGAIVYCFRSKNFWLKSNKFKFKYVYIKESILMMPIKYKSNIF